MESNNPKLNDIDDYVEKEVAPGVFLTDYRKIEHKDSKQDITAPSAESTELDDLECLIDPHSIELEPGKQKQIMAGVYMTDFRDPKTITHTSVPSTSFGATVNKIDHYDHPELADARVRELINSISHLERSNAELEAMKLEDPDDPLWQETIDENLIVIAKQKAEIEKITEKLPKISKANVAAVQK